MKRPLPWRVKSGDEGDFDELVVSAPAGGECLIHAEMMTKRSIFVSIGDLSVWAHVKHGKVVVTMIENGTGVVPVTVPERGNDG